MKNNAWIAVLITFGIIGFAMMLHALFVTIKTPDGAVIEGGLFTLSEGSNVTITGNDATNTITIAATGAANSLDLQFNGTTTVTGATAADFVNPLTVSDEGGGVGQIGVDWPDCELKPQATTFTTSSNTIDCQFIANSKGVPNGDSSSPWMIPGWACVDSIPVAGVFTNDQNDILYTLIIPPETTTYTSIGLNVSAAGGTVARLGIYNAGETTTGYEPTTLLLDAGTVAINSTGNKTIAISVTLERGRPYFLTMVHDAGTLLRMTTCDPARISLTPLTGRSGGLGSQLTGSIPVSLNVGTGAFSSVAPTVDSLELEYVGTWVRLSE